MAIPERPPTATTTTTTTATKTKASHPGGIDYVLLALLAAAWGASFVLIKVAVTEVPPASMAAIRLTFAAGVLWIAMLAAGARLPSDRRSWMLALIVAFLGNSFPFLLIGWGQQRIEAGLSAILMGVMPLTTILLAHFLVPDDRLSLGKLAGILLGLAGVTVLVGPEKLMSLGIEAQSQIAVAFAAICYGGSAVATRRLMGPGSQLGLATAVQSLAALMSWPAALVIDGRVPAMPSTTALAAIVCLGVVQTGLAQLLLFQIVARQGASFFSQINFIVPVVGVMWGALLLGERLPIEAFVALGLVLAGLGVSRLR